MTEQRQAAKQFVILSGKGGTGKTSLSAAFAHLAYESADEKRSVLVDADVDAANLGLVLQPQVQQETEFWGGSIAHIDPDNCLGCGDCAEVCRYDAVKPQEVDGRDIFRIDELACDGCASCVYSCPQNAIEMQRRQEGLWFHSSTRFGELFHAELFAGKDNSGKLVTTVKQFARLYAEDHGIPLLIIDGPPGIGCPVISASAGADLGLVVTEPSAAGIHDLKRIVETLQHFRVPALICINKADIYPKGVKIIQEYAAAENIDIVGEIPFDPAITNAMVQGQPVTVQFPESKAAQALSAIWERLSLL